MARNDVYNKIVFTGAEALVKAEKMKNSSDIIDHFIISITAMVSFCAGAIAQEIPESDE